MPKTIKLTQVDFMIAGPAAQPTFEEAVRIVKKSFVESLAKYPGKVYSLKLEVKSK